MRHRKSRRHAHAANCRWREWRAAAERDRGIEDRLPVVDTRQPIDLDLRCVGGPRVVLEPRAGYMAWRLRDADTGEVTRCAAIKTLLREIADSLPRQRAPGATYVPESWTAQDEADAALA